MKKILTIFAAALMAVCSANAGTITKSISNLGEFSGIQVGNSFKATIIQGEAYTATVTIDTDYEVFLDVKVIGTVLYVRLKDVPKKLRNLAKKTMEVTICTPTLNRLYLTGAASVRSDAKWENPLERFTLNLKGASKAERLHIEGPELKAEISGASNCGVIGDFGSVELLLEGASAATVSGNCNDITLTANGASKATIIGEAESIDADCHGSSRLDGSSLAVDEAKIVCSGASKATIEVNEVLDVELSGSSTCRYRTRNNMIRVIPTINRASSLKRID